MKEVKGIIALSSLSVVTCPGHEETDPRVILNPKDMVEKGLKNIVIHSVGTDVLV